MTKAPPLRAIQAFEAFGRLGSVTAAAAELGVSAGAVSQQIRHAEEALAILLVERKGRSMALTSWGRMYHDAVSSSFRQLRDARDMIERMRSASGLTISCLPSLASKWLAPNLFDWQSQNAGASVHLIGEEAEPDLAQGQADFRVSYGAKARDYSHYAELFTDWIVPACAPSLLARHRPETASDILDGPLLGVEWARDHRSPPSWSEWAESIGESEGRTNGEVTFSLSSAAIDAAVNGRGFVLAQWSMAADDILAGRLVVPFDRALRLPAPYFLAWDRSSLEKPLAVQLRAWLAATAQKLQNAAASRFAAAQEVRPKS